MVDYHGFLNPSDGVAISFWIISIAMVAATVFFLMESMNVGYHWKTLNVSAPVTLLRPCLKMLLWSHTQHINVSALHPSADPALMMLM